jgi:hypothetical protein
VRRLFSNVACTLLLVIASSPHLANGEVLSGDDREFFENRIRPVLVKHCYECHAADSKKIGGKLLLDSRDGILKGGESGPALVAAKPGKSLIIQALRHDDIKMPPDQPLSASVVKDFENWIARGAPDPRSKKTAKKGDAAPDQKALWSFQPWSAPTVPDVQNKGWPRDPLDRFALARIEAAGLAPTKDAASRTLVRRLYYDLIGLPPSIAEVEAFGVDHQRDSAKAVERLVDALLAKPQFGERWGRHWLDVARYAEANGGDGLGRNASFPHAWRYRDYVIDALNRDVPYDRFVTEQIAGDLLPAESAKQRNRQLVATGFLAIGSKPASAMNKNFKMDIVADQINVVSTAVMGVSVACARCHDHKHDPIPTRDYYALAGIFSSTETLYGLAGNEKLTAPPTALHELKSVWNKGDAVKQPKGAAPKFPATYSAAIDALKPVVHAKLDAAPRKLTVPSDVRFSPQSYAKVKSATIHGRLPVADKSYSVAFWFKNDTKNNARPITAYLFSRGELGNRELPGDHLGIGGKHEKSRTGKLFVFNGNVAKQSVAGSTVIPAGTWNHVVMVRDGSRVKVFLNGGPDAEIDAKLPLTFGDSPEFCLASRSDKFAPLVGNLAEFAVFASALSDDKARQLHAASGQSRGVRTLGLAMGVRDKSKVADCKLHVKGDVGKLGPSVPRGFLTAYSDLDTVAINPKQSGRLQLAQWLTRPKHPQTARVMVNRVWLHLFGQGLVATPNDFGVYGARPSHPELLDHLADRFVRESWSTKRLIRAIVLSRTYQLESRCDPALVQADPDNKLLARHNRRRLDAESLRDSILQAAGQLDLSPGQGSAVEKIDTLINWPPGETTNLHRKSNHRSVYLCMLRHAPPPELAAFDLPDGVGITGQRNVTTLPTHALYLLNSSFVVEQAQALAASAMSAAAKDDARRVRDLFRRTLQRNPSKIETQQAIEQVRAIEGTLDRESLDAQARTQKAWASLCQALLTTNEFRYID